MVVVVVVVVVVVGKDGFINNTYTSSKHIYYTNQDSNSNYKTAINVREYTRDSELIV